jgi:spore germination protein GerM
MKAKKTNYAGVIALLLIGAAGVYGVGFYIGRTPDASKVPDAIRRETPSVQKEPVNEPSQGTELSSVKVLTPKSKGSDLTFDETTEAVGEGKNPIVFAVNRYLENTEITPREARALSVEVKDGVAFIDVNEKMQGSYGSSDERTLIQGLCKTLAQFPEVKKFQFLISGKPMEPWGNVDLSEPLDVRPVDDQSTSPGA